MYGITRRGDVGSLTYLPAQPPTEAGLREHRACAASFGPARLGDVALCAADVSGLELRMLAQSPPYAAEGAARGVRGRRVSPGLER